MRKIKTFRQRLIKTETFNNQDNMLKKRETEDE